MRAWSALLSPYCPRRCAARTLACAQAAMSAWIHGGDEDQARAAGRLAVVVSRWSEDCLPSQGKRIVVLSLEATASRCAETSARTAVAALRDADRVPYWASERAAKRAGIGRGRLRHAIRDALVPWVLGVEGPLAR